MSMIVNNYCTKWDIGRLSVPLYLNLVICAREACMPQLQPEETVNGKPWMAVRAGSLALLKAYVNGSILGWSLSLF
jgi:hypothetical protein